MILKRCLSGQLTTLLSLAEGSVIYGSQSADPLDFGLFVKMIKKKNKFNIVRGTQILETGFLPIEIYAMCQSVYLEGDTIEIT